MITFNDIYEASKKERYSEKLQELPEKFILEVAEYLKEKKKMSLKNEDDFSEIVVKTKKQLENAGIYFKELMNRRRRKILNLVLIASETGISKRDFDNMLNFERELFENLMKCTESFNKKISEVLNPKKVKLNENEKIVFKEEVGEFVDLEGKKIGGFKKDEIVELPKQIANILIEDGKAEVVFG
jgi:DNA replication initiation complex subunit (GINS family)